MGKNSNGMAVRDSCRGYSSSIKQNQNRLNRMDEAVFCFYAHPKFPLEVILLVRD
jgi:hypothetical protein